MQSITSTTAFTELCNAAQAHPDYQPGQPLLLDFGRAMASIQAGVPTLEGNLLEAHIRAAAACNPSLCYIFDALRASARGDARTGRTLRSAGTDGAPYWTGMGSSRTFRMALAALPWLSQAHQPHAVTTQNGPDGTSGQAGRSWQGAGFTRTRTQVTIAAQPVDATPGPDLDGMDAPQPVAPIRRGKGKRTK